MAELFISEAASSHSHLDMRNQYESGKLQLRDMRHDWPRYPAQVRTIAKLLSARSDDLGPPMPPPLNRRGTLETANFQGAAAAAPSSIRRLGVG
ncbi:hypothetical protein [Bradyrhizobium sp. DASA03120]|uniref:hypothetical protein n=1 Tax=Bradyrhizobium sp. SMVTL-02 TaxID=3395917 RepID=UPI003F720891